MPTINITRQRSIYISLSLVVLFFIFAYLQSFFKSELISDFPKAAKNQVSQSDQTSTTFTLNEFQRSEIKNGKKIWEIKADSGSYDQVTLKTYVTNPRLWIYEKEDKVIELSANSANLDLTAGALNQVELNEEVELKTSDNLLVKTDLAYYYKLEEKLACPGKVYIKSDLIETTGIGLEAFFDKKEFKLLKSVRSLIKPKSTERKKL